MPRGCVKMCCENSRGQGNRRKKGRQWKSLAFSQAQLISVGLLGIQGSRVPEVVPCLDSPGKGDKLFYHDAQLSPVHWASTILSVLCSKLHKCGRPAPFHYTAITKAVCLPGGVLLRNRGSKTNFCVYHDQIYMSNSCVHISYDCEGRKHSYSLVWPGYLISIR